MDPNRNQRFQTPDAMNEFQSEYDIPSSELQDIIGRNPRAFSVYTLDLSVAGTQQINEAGFGFVLYGFNPSDQSKYSEAFVNVAINAENNADPSQIFPAKTGRGFVGSFSKLMLSWPLDSNAPKATFIVFKSCHYPWIGGLEAS